MLPSTKMGNDFHGERVIAKRLMAKLHPSDAKYRPYRMRVDDLLGLFSGHRWSDSRPGQTIVSLRMRRSLLFGREYLVAYADPKWMRKSFPTMDAVAADGLVMGPMVCPPLVLLPADKRSARAAEFQSIVEHEFVHVNQMILGLFSLAPPTGNAEDLMESLLDITRAEYEANLLQLIRWPQLYIRSGHKQGLSLDSWCVIRGYRQALSHIVHTAAKGRLAGGAFFSFLSRLRGSLKASFHRMGLSEEMGEHCANNVREDVLATCRSVAEVTPGMWDTLEQLYQTRH